MLKTIKKVKKSIKLAKGMTNMVNELLERQATVKPNYAQMVNAGFTSEIEDCVTLVIDGGQFDIMLVRFNDLGSIAPPVRYATIATNGTNTTTETHYALTMAQAKYKQVYQWAMNTFKEQGYSTPTMN